MSLANDIATIRKQRKLSIEDIHELTRIPIHTITKIEDGSIFNDPSQNTTYVRSFVRSYTKALKISEDDIVAALDESFAGNYNGRILNIYESGVMPLKHTIEGAKSPTKSIPEKPKSSKTSPPKKESSDNEEPVKPHQLEYNKTEEPPGIKSVNWIDMSNRIYSFKSNQKFIVIGIVLLILIFIIGYFIFQPKEITETPQAGNQNVIPIDTTAIAPLATDSLLITEPTIPETERIKKTVKSTVQLPDTLELLIYAAYNKLEPVRVKSDMVDTFSPYWIEKGHAMRFFFTKDVYIKGQLGRMELLVNGHLVEDFNNYRAEDFTVYLQRSLFEKNPGFWLSKPPNSLPRGIPSPDTVYNRPVF